MSYVDAEAILCGVEKKEGEKRKRVEDAVQAAGRKVQEASIFCRTSVRRSSADLAAPRV